MNPLLRAKNEILDLLFPPICAGCGKEGEFFCNLCKKTLIQVPPKCFACGKLSPGTKRIPQGRTCTSCRAHTPIYAFISPFLYRQEPVRELIHNLKYLRVYGISRVLAKLLINYLSRFKIRFPKNSILVPLPLHSRRERTRGFNQSRLIAESLAESSDIQIYNNVLIRTENTRPQIELRAEERRANIIGAFAAIFPEKIRDKTVILLDDVKTTGSTLEEAAHVLKSAGAKKIWAITIAH
ncbi:MAG: ComF family protein [Candidatus Sungbacteria bacterium]|nr:ComF family protein [Candidatus Sungbacteria bacterium]